VCAAASFAPADDRNFLDTQDGMLFPTFQFLIFFCVTFAVYWGLKQHRLRMGWLLVASCFFYMSWNPWLILLILFSAGVDFVSAIVLENATRTWVRRTILTASICTNLGLLAYFKYANFFLQSASQAAAWLKIEWVGPLLETTLPLGISFYTFETISYMVDVYSGRSKAVRKPLDYAVFILFFPHLIAGPIVRPRDFLPQIRQRGRWDWDRLYLGARFFILGFFKKAVLADRLAEVVDPVFAAPDGFASSAIWLAVLAYAVQIYFDFSGYSDMAVGLAHTLGFKLPQNFRWPYLASSPADFWRRWHISLSTWLRDYLYLPLGGNRLGTLRTYCNLIAVMVLGGLWHGASWTFVAWGCYHGVLLAVHRALPWPQFLSKPLFRPLCVLTTFVLVCVGWVFFRANTFQAAEIVLGRMFWPTAGKHLDVASKLLVAVCLALTFAGGLLSVNLPLAKLERRLPAPLMGAALALVVMAALLLFPMDSKAFIYFQF
jgi:alginate O-acetyltransferase complex protein AlgI